MADSKGPSQVPPFHPGIRVRWDVEPAGLPDRPAPLTDVEMADVFDRQRRGQFRALLPMLGDYPVYEPIDYYLMSCDAERQECYEEALRTLVPGKVVVDIGTGQFAVWAIASVKLGARKVYAIEASRDASEQARRLVAELGLGAKIEILEGLSETVTLPEKADVCVSEVLGCIGSSEGAGILLEDARRRHLKPGGAMVPAVCETRAALVSLPEAWSEDPRFGPWGAYYTDRVFAAVGYPFDLRLMFFGGIDPSLVLSSDTRVERLVLGHPLDGTPQRGTLVVERPGHVYGLVLWIELWCREGGPSISSRSPGCFAWYPAFFPLFHPGERVGPGDRVHLSWTASPSDNGINPDYRIEGELERRDGPSVPFATHSSHHAEIYRANSFYRQLFTEP